MKSLFKVAIRDTFKDKGRTFFMVFNIFLSSVLVTLVFSLTTGIDQSILKFRFEETNPYNVEIRGVKDPDSVLIIQKDVEAFTLESNVGEYILLETGPATGGSYNVVNRIMTEDDKTNLIEGRFAENSREVSLSKSMKDAIIESGLDIKLNQNIEIFDHNNEETQVKVVGIYNNLKESYVDIQTINTTQSADSTLYIKYYDDSLNYDENLGKLRQIDEVTIIENMVRNSYLGFVSEIEPLTFLINLFGLVLLMIVGYTSGLMIYNSVKLNIDIKADSYSLFRSVGATKRQVRTALFIEMFVLTIIATVVGALFGILLSKYSMQAIKPLFSSAIGFEQGLAETMKPNVSILMIPFIILVTLLITFIPTVIATRKIFRKSSMQTINQLHKIKRKRLEPTRTIGFLFNQPGVLAMKNCRRDNGKYKVTRHSLVLMIITVVLISSFTQSALESSKGFSDDYTYVITVSSREKLELDLRDTIESMVSYTQIQSYFDENTITLDNHSIHQGILMNYFVILEDTQYSEYLKEFDLQSLSDDEILFVDFYRGIDYDYTSDLQNVIYNNRLSELSVGDTLSIQSKQMDETVEEIIEYKIGIILDHLPMNLPFYDNPSVVTILNETQADSLLQVDQNRAYVYQIESNDPDAVMLSLENYKDSSSLDFSVNNKAEVQKNHEIIFKSVSDILNLIIVLVTIISIISVLNTSSQDIRKRSVEFSSLESIGMTRGQISLMITLESIITMSTALVLGLVLSVSLAYGIHAVFGQKLYLYVFSIDSRMLIVTCLSVFVILMMQIINSRMLYKKNSIIETLKGVV